MHRVASHPHLESAHAEYPAAAYASPAPASIFHIELDVNERRQRLSFRAPALLLHPSPAPPRPPSSLLFKRSISDLGPSLLDCARSRPDISGLRSSGAVQRLLEACKPTSTLEKQLRSHLRQLLPSRPTLPQLSAALSSLGYLVQPLCGGSSEDTDTKRPSSAWAAAAAGMHCLQHHSIVCTGAQQPLCTQPTLLAEPLVIDISFREQFIVQFGSSSVPTSYECLLMAVPSTFVGTLPRLEAVVTLLAREVSATFKRLQRPLPPWRKKAAIMSRWAPDVLRDLAKAAAAAAAAGQQLGQQQQDDSQHSAQSSRRSSQDSNSSGPQSASSAGGLLGDEEGGAAKMEAGGKLACGSGGSSGVYGVVDGARGAARSQLVIQRIQSWNLPGRGRRQESALAAALRGSGGVGAGAGGSAAHVPDRVMSTPLTSAVPCTAAAAPAPVHSLYERLAFRFHTVKLGSRRAAK